METIIASVIASVATRVVVHPLDSLKVRVQNATTPGTRSLVAVLRSTRDFRSLYNGISVTLCLGAPGLAVFLSTYEGAKAVCAARLGLAPDAVVTHAIAGTVAESVSGAIWTPMEVLKSKLQVDTGVSAVETMGLARSIYREEGLRGFFRGYFVTLGVFIPQSVIYFTIYEQCKMISRNHSESVSPFVGYLVSSGIASTISASLSNIFDVVKTRIQVASQTNYDSTSVIAVASKMYREEGGLMAFSRGISARVISLVPATMLSMTIFEVIKDWFKS
ncbi:mitochondrial carrier domain-containing protein [Chytriomyces sp. MP71]|nr:mitochondrial carrier domain-containing protein [Chytriomyces sp. MP71]